MVRVAHLQLQSYPGSVRAHIYPVLKVRTYNDGDDPNDDEFESIKVRHAIDTAEAKKLNKEKCQPGEPRMYSPGMSVQVCFKEDKAVEYGIETAKANDVDILFRGNHCAAIPKDIIYGPDHICEMFEDGPPEWDEWKPVSHEFRHGSIPDPTASH